MSEQTITIKEPWLASQIVAMLTDEGVSYSASAPETGETGVVIRAEDVVAVRSLLRKHFRLSEFDVSQVCTFLTEVLLGRPLLDGTAKDVENINDSLESYREILADSSMESSGWLDDLLACLQLGLAKDISRNREVTKLKWKVCVEGGIKQFRLQACSCVDENAMYAIFPLRIRGGVYQATMLVRPQNCGPTSPTFASIEEAFAWCADHESHLSSSESKHCSRVEGELIAVKRFQSS